MQNLDVQIAQGTIPAGGSEKQIYVRGQRSIILEGSTFQVRKINKF
jgi:hypothetical protein